MLRIVMRSFFFRITGKYFNILLVFWKETAVAEQGGTASSKKDMMTKQKESAKQIEGANSRNLDPRKPSCLWANLHSPHVHSCPICKIRHKHETILGNLYMFYLYSALGTTKFSLLRLCLKEATNSDCVISDGRLFPSLIVAGRNDL